MNKKVLSLSLALVMLIILSSALFLIKKPNSKPPNVISDNKKASGILNFSSDISNNPDSATWKEWGTKVSEDEINDKLSFKLTFPPKDKEDISSRLIAIMVEGDANPGNKVDAVNLFFSSGVRVMQMLWPSTTPPTTRIEDMSDENDQDKYKYWKNIDINGLDGVGYAPRDQKTMDGLYRAPGAVSWYEPKTNVAFTVYGNGNIPLESLIEVARLFNSDEK